MLPNNALALVELGGYLVRGIIAALCGGGIRGLRLEEERLTGGQSTVALNVSITPNVHNDDIVSIYCI